VTQRRKRGEGGFYKKKSKRRGGGVASQKSRRSKYIERCVPGCRRPSGGNRVKRHLRPDGWIMKSRNKSRRVMGQRTNIQPNVLTKDDSRRKYLSGKKGRLQGKKRHKMTSKGQRNHRGGGGLKLRRTRPRKGEIRGIRLNPR